MSSSTTAMDSKKSPTAEAKTSDSWSSPNLDLIRNGFTWTTFGRGLGEFALDLAYILPMALLWAAAVDQPLKVVLSHPLALSTNFFTVTHCVFAFKERGSAADPDVQRLAKSFGRSVRAVFNLLALLTTVASLLYVWHTNVTEGKPALQASKGIHTSLPTIMIATIASYHAAIFAAWLTPSFVGGQERADAVFNYQWYFGCVILGLLLVAGNKVVDTAYKDDFFTVRLWVSVAISIVAVATNFIYRDDTRPR